MKERAAQIGDHGGRNIDFETDTSLSKREWKGKLVPVPPGSA